MDRAAEPGAPGRTGIRCEQRKLKRELFTVLEHRCFGWRDYWSALRRFTAGRLSKAELDAQVHRLLGAENLPLHNAFVLAVIRGACFDPAPTPSRATGECRAKIQRRRRPRGAAVPVPSAMPAAGMGMDKDMGAPAGSADRAVQLATEPPSPSRAPLPSYDAPSPNVSEVTTGTTAERLRPDADTLARWEREAEESVAKEMAAAAAAAATAAAASEAESAPAAAWVGEGTGRLTAAACAVSTENTAAATGVRARKRLQREHDEQQGLYASDAKAMGRAIQIVRSKAIRARCKAQLARANALKGALVKLARQVKVAKAQQAKSQRQQYGAGSSAVAGGSASAGTVTTPRTSGDSAAAGSVTGRGAYAGPLGHLFPGLQPTYNSIIAVSLRMHQIVRAHADIDASVNARGGNERQALRPRTIAPDAVLMVTEAVRARMAKMVQFSHQQCSTNADKQGAANRVRESVGSSCVGSTSEANSPSLRPHFLLCPPGSSATVSPLTSAFASNLVCHGSTTARNTMAQGDSTKLGITAEAFARTAQWSSDAFFGSTRSALSVALRLKSGSACHRSVRD